MSHFSINTWTITKFIGQSSYLYFYFIISVKSVFGFNSIHYELDKRLLVYFLVSL